MKYIFSSIFASEITQHLDILKEAGRTMPPFYSAFRNLDKYLVISELSNKILTEDILTQWARTLNISSGSKAQYISQINGFVKYLVSVGVPAIGLERSKIHSDYVAYIFTEDEFERIFYEADNYKAGKSFSQTPLLFPILLRILYGCGMRVGEGLNLRWKDVDLESGVLTVRKGKNKKQRFVPMSESLTKLLSNYNKVTQFEGICEDYLFESNLNKGNPLRKNTFSEWFARVCCSAGIVYAKKTIHERGPCPHCLRHCFTLKSFLKLEDKGQRFEDTAPTLAAYLGHEGPLETEKYLSSNYVLYVKSHQRVDTAIGYLFPEVTFDED